MARSLRPSARFSINMAFFNCSRFGSKSLLASLPRFSPGLATSQYALLATGAPKIMFKTYDPPKPESHDERNAKLNRPLSPHLTIYAFPLPAMLSITHRASGILLSTYASALGIGALVLPYDVSHYIGLIENLSPATIFLLKFIIAAPFSYHLVNGMRHLYWDTAKGLSMKDVYKTGYAMLASSVLLTLIIAAL